MDAKPSKTRKEAFKFVEELTQVEGFEEYINRMAATAEWLASAVYLAKNYAICNAEATAHVDAAREGWPPLDAAPEPWSQHERI